MEWMTAGSNERASKGSTQHARHCACTVGPGLLCKLLLHAAGRATDWLTLARDARCIRQMGVDP